MDSVLFSLGILRVDEPKLQYYILTVISVYGHPKSFKETGNHYLVHFNEIRVSISILGELGAHNLERWTLYCLL